ncbi:MAG: type III PLP-dependent enzyme [Pseudomonadota bacterium]
MHEDRRLSETATQHLLRTTPDHPVLYVCPDSLVKTLRVFQSSFCGMTTFAVKANPDPTIIENFAAAGLAGYDVASSYEVELVHRIAPDAPMHYNNPVRSKAEIKHALAHGVRSFSVDRPTELLKLVEHAPRTETEVSVRLKLPLEGAAYDFGEKYGASPAFALPLLQQARDLGFIVSMTFHPGTQCRSPDTWRRYITECAELAKAAGVRLHRLNVGGGFPSQRKTSETSDLTAVFDCIHQTVETVFDAPPALVCEPGRALVAEACTLAVRVKSIDDDDITLNDGVYGGMSEFRDIYPVDRIDVIAPTGAQRLAAKALRPIFGPTCDSLDTIPGGLPLPADTEEEDYLLIRGMGAYAIGIGSRFNGYGAIEVVPVSAV